MSSTSIFQGFSLDFKNTVLIPHAPPPHELAQAPAHQILKSPHPRIPHHLTPHTHTQTHTHSHTHTHTHTHTQTPTMFSTPMGNPVLYILEAKEILKNL